MPGNSSGGTSATGTNVQFQQIAQAANQVQLPDFPKLSEHAPRLARIDPGGVAAWEKAIIKYMKDMTFNVQKLPPT